MIDNICRSRGLVKFGAGTNRVVYRHPEFNNILFKIATDDVGMGDNPAEFRNQFLLKPFCAKTFEISPCGTVALVERLKPIRSREEYLSVAEDVFELLYTWIIGKYIMADIGDKYFMNIGIRQSMGICILDYPYLYELDGKKLYCRAPDPKSPSGCCDGEIDYDDGFNILHCTKCGVKYRAKELAKNIEENKIVTVEEGSNLKMNIKVSGGSRNINRVETVGGALGVEAKALTGKDMVKVIPSHGNVNSPKVTIDQNQSNHNSKIEFVDNEVPVLKTVNGKFVEPVMEKPAPAAVKVHKEENIEKTFVEPAEAAAKPAVTFGDKTASTKDNTSPVFEIEKAIETIITNIQKIDIKEVKTDLEDRMFDKLINSGVDKMSLGKLLIKLLGKAADVNNEILTDPTMINDFIEKYYDLAADFNVDNSKVNVSLRTITGGKEVLYLIEDNKLPKNNEDTSKEAPATDEESNNSAAFNGISFYSSKKINTKDITPSLKPEEQYDVIAILDENGNYLTDRSNFLIAIDFVDNTDVSDAAIVSKKWLDGVIAENESHGGNPFKTEEDTTEPEKSIPVGALPETQVEDSSVQQAMENFINSENK
ncbi:MAG: hypothetical protein IKR19_07755 [Acholeplasmatales bacterium]|nr:hypothetical protein [Acholeplasmatales bacterium]